MKKRMISLLLCAVMLIGLLPMNALVAAAITINPDDAATEIYGCEWEDSGYTYRFNVYQDTQNNHSLYAELYAVTIPSDATELTIPGTFAYTPYTPEDAGEQQIPLRVISGVESNAIKSVSIPASVEIIGANVFANYSNLETVTFPESSNGESSKLRTIGDSAFSGCSSLTTCVLPETVETIGSKAFFGTGLTSVKFGAALETLGTEAFASCEELAELDMSEVTELEVIPYSCFSSHALSTLTIPNCVKTIGDWAFADPYGPNDEPGPLASLTLGQRVETIGEYAFNGNRNLTGKLILPDSVSSIGTGAFADCGYTDVKWPEGNGDFTEVNGFSCCRSLSGAAITSLPVTVTTIGEEAFSDCINLGSVTIPSSVTTIKEKAFSNAGITSLTIKYGVETIETNAFQGCTGLLGTEITIPDSVTTLASGAFSELFTRNGTEDAPLTVKVMDPDLDLTAETDKEYIYFAADDTEHTNYLYTGDAFGGCVNLILYAPAGASTAKAYAEKFNGVTIRASTDYTFFDFPRTVEFRELADVPVYHTVTLPTAPGVTFTVKQDGVTLPLDGNTVQALSGKEVVVTAHREGYYDQELVKTGADFTENWTVTLGEWKALPVSDKLLVSITRDGLPLGSFDGLDLSLEKDSGETVDFEISYPYLVLTEIHGIDPSEELILTVTPDASMQLTDGSATGTLQDGGFTVALQSWGKAAITATGTTAAPCVVILFDGAGNAVSSGTTSGGVFTSDPLPAGAYKVVAYETNDYFGAVGSEDALSALGLTPSDYAEGSVTIADGSTKELTLTVPKLNTGDLTSVLDTGKCSLAFRSSRVVTDQAFDMWVNYALKTGTAQEITFTLPAGASIQSVHNEQESLTVDGTNSVTVNNASGTLYVSVKCTETGIKSFGASVTTGGTTLPLGSGTVTVQNIFIEEADSYTAKREGNRVSVYTAPGARVILTIPGAATVRGRANAAGRATLTYSLPDDAVYGQSYTLTAEANGGIDKTSITYFPASAELQWFGFHHYWNDITVIDNIQPNNEKKYYTYYAFGNEKSKHFSFGATFKADQKLDVTVIVTMQDGSVRSVPMTLIDEADGIQTYAGELYLAGNSDDHVFHADSIPVGFEIDWDDPVAELDGDDLNNIYNQALARATERQSIREEEWEDFLLEENLTQAEEESMNIFFNYGYRITNTDDFKASLLTKEKYEALKAESNASEIAKLDEFYAYDTQYLAGAYAAEAMMDEAADALTDALQLDKPIQQYSGWDEILSEMGMEYGDCAYTAADLEADGYTQMGDFWYKDDGNGSFTAVWPDGFNAGSEPAAAALRLEETPSAGMYTARETGGGYQISWDSTQKAVDGNWLQTGITTAGHSLNATSDYLKTQSKATQDFVNSKRATLNTDYPGDANLQKRQELSEILDKKEKCAQKQAKGARAAKWAGRACGLANLKMDADQLNENIVATAESEARASELDVLIRYYTTHIGPAGCLSAMQDEKRAYDLLNDLMNQKSNHLIANVLVGSVTTALDFTTASLSSKAMMAYDVASGVAMFSRDAMIAEMQKTVEKLHAKRVSVCGGEGWKKAPLRTLTPILDPSGIVYEAVESNVLSGVTATIYEVSGGETLWNAGAYDQTNPLITGADGGYAWDVPTGTWQVKFTKDGYEDAATDTLPVPPPQMNLKTAMVSTAAPTVVSAAAYPDYVELVFSQYMSVTDTLTVPAGYTYEWVNKERVSAEDSTEYSKVLHLKKSAAVGDTVAVTLSGAKNYAGTDLAAYSSGALTVEVEPASLQLNYETQIAVLVGEEKDPRVTVQVLDSSGQPISGLTVTAAIEDTAYATVTEVQGTTDASGVAVFSVKGLLPGWTEAAFAVEGSSLTKTIPVRVTIESNQAAKPVAFIGGNVYTTSTNSITVPRGSALTLTCATAGAVIYYTTNDTCPCQALDRQLYTGPITVNEDTYFRIAAYKDGMEYSERLNLRVSVSESSHGGGNGGDGGYTPGYSVAVEQPENGSVTISPKSASKGDIVTVTVIPDKGYTLETLTVTDKNGNELKLTEKNGRYTFTMPASKVTVKATFMEDNSMLNFFVDVPANAYYYDAVAWAVKNKITEGTGDGTTFSPNANCTRGQIVTFLWRAAGCPEPESGENPFTDVKEGTYYYKAVLWAVENSITEGTGDGTTFSPEQNCTRGQTVTFLWRAAGKTAVAGEVPFTDVSADAYYTSAVLWAVEDSITDGTGDGTTFSPAASCTRGQIVTFIWRWMVK